MAAKIIVILLTIAFGTIQAADPLENAASVQLKSESHALSWSLSCTALPILAGIGILTHSEKDEWEVTGGVLISSGVMLGPGVGYIYAGQPSRIWLPMALRTVGVVLIGAGGHTEYVSDGNLDEEPKFGVVSGIGLMLYLGSTFYDFLKVGAAVRDYNSSHTADRITLTPLVDQSKRQVMLVASWSF